MILPNFTFHRILPMEELALQARVPYRILTPRTELRCYRKSDLGRMTEAVTSSVRDLKNWFPWALAEPIKSFARAQHIASMIARYEAGEDFTMGIFSPDGSRQLGGTGLHPRGRASTWEIGYWIREDAQGQGLATEVANALTIVALGWVQLPRLEIRCEARNVRSRRIPERLDFRFEGTLRSFQRDVHGNLCDVEVRALLEKEFADWPHRDFPIQCFDRANRPILMPAL
jgi:RimJ/RimL family protein N-acetyltransferase